MRKRQPQSLSIEGDRSVKIAHCEMSLEQARDRNEGSGIHRISIGCTRSSKVTSAGASDLSANRRRADAWLL